MSHDMTETSDVGLITLGAASIAALSPVVSLLVSSYLQHRARLEDYARQDAVAAKAAEAAKLLLAAQAETTKQNQTTQSQLNHIHTLVNSNLTREMRDRLAALKGQVHLTRELIRLNKQNGLEPDVEALAALDSLQKTASELEAALKERNSVSV